MVVGPGLAVYLSAPHTRGPTVLLLFPTMFSFSEWDFQSTAASDGSSALASNSNYCHINFSSGESEKSLLLPRKQSAHFRGFLSM